MKKTKEEKYEFVSATWHCDKIQDSKEVLDDIINKKESNLDFLYSYACLKKANYLMGDSFHNLPSFMQSLEEIQNLYRKMTDEIVNGLNKITLNELAEELWFLNMRPYHSESTADEIDKIEKNKT